MCLIVDKEVNPRVITEPMKVYKVLQVNSTGRIRSPFENYPYTIDQLYTSQIEQTDDFSYCCNVDGDRLRSLYPNGYEQHTYAYGKGFHFITDIEAYAKVLIAETPHWEEWFDKVFECEIPAGAKVIESLGLGITNKIIIRKQL